MPWGTTDSTLRNVPFSPRFTTQRIRWIASSAASQSILPPPCGIGSPSASRYSSRHIVPGCFSFMAQYCRTRERASMGGVGRYEKTFPARSPLCRNFGKNPPLGTVKTPGSGVLGRVGNLCQLSARHPMAGTFSGGAKLLAVVVPLVGCFDLLGVRVLRLARVVVVALGGSFTATDGERWSRIDGKDCHLEYPVHSENPVTQHTQKKVKREQPHQPTDRQVIGTWDSREGKMFTIVNIFTAAADSMSRCCCRLCCCRLRRKLHRYRRRKVEPDRQLIRQRNLSFNLGFGLEEEHAGQNGPFSRSAKK